LSIFTWEGSLFLLPALLFMLPKRLRTIRMAGVFVCSGGLLTGAVYVAAAFKSIGLTGPRDFLMWVTHYSENGTLPIWGFGRSSEFP